MYRYTTLAAGGFFIAFGVLGFIPPLHENWPSDEPMMTVRNGRGFLFGVFPNNFALSLLHLVVGAWGVVAFRSPWTSRLFVRGAAAIFLVLGVCGVLPMVDSLAGVFPTFGGIAWVHGTCAALLVAVAVIGHLRGIPARKEQPEPALGTGAVSVASVAGVPLHVLLASFPLAFLLGAVGTDLAHWWTTLDWYVDYDAFWATASVWLIGAGLAGSVLAAISGLVDVWTVPEVRKRDLLSLHVSGSIGATVLAAINLAIRFRDHDGGVVPWGILLSVLTAVLLAYCGWYAGHLIHRKVISTTSGREEGVEVQ